MNEPKLLYELPRTTLGFITGSFNYESMTDVIIESTPCKRIRMIYEQLSCQVVLFSPNDKTSTHLMFFDEDQGIANGVKLVELLKVKKGDLCVYEPRRENGVSYLLIKESFCEEDKVTDFIFSKAKTLFYKILFFVRYSLINNEFQWITSYSLDLGKEIVPVCINWKPV